MLDLNDLTLELLKKDSFLIDNIDFINNLSNVLFNELKDIDLDNKSITNHLTYKDIFEISFDIIGHINSMYLFPFSTLIDNGIINFEYETDSKIYYKYLKINIKREFNYTDVIILIHEFFHYLNRGNTNNRYILTEFISIYFEFIATNYLIKNIDIKEIDYLRRFRNTYKCINYYLKLNKILTNYFKYSELTDFKIKDNESKNIKKQYKYILGVSLALYSFNNCNMKDIVKLNDNINNYNYLNIFEILNNIGINIDNNFYVEITKVCKKMIKIR